MDTLNKGVSHVSGEIEWVGERLHHVTKGGAYFKTYEWLISGISHLIFSDHGWSQLTEAVESETTDRGGAYTAKGTE